ncbi:hypothetical protein DPMN_038571 [Dreissena polymorpha]|uniref:Uncharacterized protein n=1 Tax=Dreissena polymorpha TaxID=45954 RepID=A0A9D4RQE5_DREPO|nr:hypothetical protein DPMN_038571 [Dreissena polymorpha]
MAKSEREDHTKFGICLQRELYWRSACRQLYWRSAYRKLFCKQICLQTGILEIPLQHTEQYWRSAYKQLYWRLLSDMQLGADVKNRDIPEISLQTGNQDRGIHNDSERGIQSYTGDMPTYRPDIFKRPDIVKGSAASNVTGSEAGYIQGLTYSMPDIFKASAVDAMPDIFKRPNIFKRPDIFKRSDIFKVFEFHWHLYDTGYTEWYMDLPTNNLYGYHRGNLTGKNVHFLHTSKLLIALVKACKPHTLQE